MEGGTAAARAAERLRAEREALAQGVTRALYRAMPELAGKYGGAGRAKCLQDMRYNVEHLAPAVELAEPAMFAGYVRWLDGLLRARNVPAAEVMRSLTLLEREIGERFPAGEAEAAARCIRAGVAALSGGPEGA